MKQQFAHSISILLGYTVVVTLAFFMSSNGYVTSKSSSVTSGKMSQLPGPTRLAMMADHQFNMLHDPLMGEIPPGIRGRELAYVKTLPSYDTAGGQSWTWRGPGNIGGRWRCVVGSSIGRPGKQILLHRPGHHLNRYAVCGAQQLLLLHRTA
jgi:hypothetical protein